MKQIFLIERDDSSKYEKEKEILQKLKGTGICLKLLDFFDNYNYLVLEKADMNLKQFLEEYVLKIEDQNEKLNKQKQILLKVVKLLRILHDDFKIVHGNLKLENLMIQLNDEGHIDIKLTDFSISCKIGEEWSIDEYGRVNLNWKSCSFEVGCYSLGLIKSHAASPKDDLFCLGLIFAEVLNSTPVFKSDEETKICFRKCFSKMKRNQNNSENLKISVVERIGMYGNRENGIGLRLLSIDPNERPSAREIENIYENLGITDKIAFGFSFSFFLINFKK